MIIGMLMYFAVTGRTYRTYDNIKENEIHLPLNIVKGKRPPIPEGIPKSYKNMIKRCWDNDPDKRPDTIELDEFFCQQSKEAAENDKIGLKLVFGGKAPNIDISEMPRSSFHYFNPPDQQQILESK